MQSIFLLISIYRWCSLKILSFAPCVSHIYKRSFYFLHEIASIVLLLLAHISNHFQNLAKSRLISKIDKQILDRAILVT